MWPGRVGGAAPNAARRAGGPAVIEVAELRDTQAVFVLRDIRGLRKEVGDAVVTISQFPAVVRRRVWQIVLGPWSSGRGRRK